jgi:hypothetical protein
MERKRKKWSPSAVMPYWEAVRVDPVAAAGFECNVVDGQDCVARNSPCPPPGWCPLTTRLFIQSMARRGK